MNTEAETLKVTIFVMVVTAIVCLLAAYDTYPIGTTFNCLRSHTGVLLCD